MFKIPKEFQVEHPFGETEGNAGAFFIPHNLISNYFFVVLASDGFGWEHVSVSLKKGKVATVKAFRKKDGPKTNPGGTYIFREKETTYSDVERCPTWGEMCFIKSLFWDDDDVVVQFHPAKKDHVNMHEFCLHLWRPLDQTIPTPPSLMVGI